MAVLMLMITYFFMDMDHTDGLQMEQLNLIENKIFIQIIRIIL